MRLTTQTDYALRLLMLLASRPETLTTISDVARHYDISKNHLMKVAHVLGRGGFIVTVRGRAGGLRLAQDASAINIGQVARETEANSALVECFPGGKGTCLISPACRLKGVLSEAVEAFYLVLEKYTIDDMIAGNEKLAVLLAPEVA